jgi:hypothetical protein
MPTLRHLIGALTVGAPTAYRALSVYPLKGPVPGSVFTYLVLDDALATGQFQVTEVSDGGVVPRLLALNETNSPVLLLDGEELVGAKQNRVVNLSLMVAARSKTEIPVSCVEAGRWRAESTALRTQERVQFARGRAQKLEQVSCSLAVREEALSDQGAVWDAISAKASRMRVASPTNAMAALFESRRDDLWGYLDAIPASKGQVGAVYAIGNVIVGLDLFDAASTYQRLARKLTASYALDAMESSDVAAPPDIWTVRAFTEQAASAPRQRFVTVGIGETVRLSGDTLVGAALEVDGCCVHLSVFNRVVAREQAAGRGPNATRMQRSSVRASRW